MDFELDTAVPLLRRTPAVLRALLLDLPDVWTTATEGPGTWSPYDVVGHLIHGERADWIPRLEHIVAHGEAVPFAPFDREAMFEESRGRSLTELLDTFAELRAANVERLVGFGLTEADYARRGRHPALGAVTLRQLLATWVTHDFSHLAQISRVIARQYTDAVGPWRAYMSVLPRPELPTNG